MHAAPSLICSILVRKFPNSTETDDDFNCDYDERLFYPNLNYGRRAFCYYTPRLWNVLPLTLRQSPSIKVFKKNLKTYLWQSFDVLMRNFNRYRNM